MQKNKRKITEVKVSQQSLFTFQGLPKVTTLNTNASAIAKQWTAYQNYISSFDVMFNASTNEDLVLAIDNLLVAQDSLAKKDFPPDFNLTNVKSRLKVSKNFILKIKGDLENRKDASASIKQLIVAHNAMQNQLNLVVSNPVNLDSIFNEE